jgi:co-chaperonin GroES (HSP10)
MIKPVGERIAIVNAEESYEGKIVLPDARQRQHIHGKCIAVGDGRMLDGTTKPIYTKPGDVYLYQVDDGTRVNCTFKIGKEVVMVLHQADMICRLKAKTVTLDTIDMVGNWLLVDTQLESTGDIVIPDAAQHTLPELQHFFLVKKGDQSKIDAKVGDEIFPARGRLTPLSIDGKIYCFITDNFIYGHLNQESIS